MSTFRKGSALVVLIAVVSLVGGGVRARRGGSADATTVAVTAGKPTEFRFTLSKRTVAKGATTFKVTNKGTLRPRLQDRRQEDRAMLDAGKAATLRVTIMKAGKYAYLCTVPGHAAGGMKGTLTVK